MQMTCTCGNLLEVADHRAGQRVRCPKCGEFLQLLELAEEAPRPGRRRTREKGSRLATIVGLVSGAVVVAGIAVGVTLLAIGGRPSGATTNSNAPGQPGNSMAASIPSDPFNIYTEKNVRQLAYSAD